MSNPIEINSVTDLLTIISEELDENAKYCYRGQSDREWELIPAIFRGFEKEARDKRGQKIDELEESERDIYSSLANRFMNFIPNVSGNKSAWEVLIYAQHHGIPTRLLDWSSNPLVALYFATCDNEDKDGRIWAAKLSKDEPISIKILEGEEFSFLIPLLDRPEVDARIRNRQSKPKKEVGNIFFQPPEIDARIRSQSSLFSVSNAPNAIMSDVRIKLIDIIICH